MRPERIIVGEVRGPEAFDLLQAMNTGHDGSMGTVHANNPREALSRMENMIAMGGLNLPQQAVREHRFREDLFYRLEVVPLRMPRLSERREDIRLLAQAFLARSGYPLPVEGFTLPHVGSPRRAMQAVFPVAWGSFHESTSFFAFSKTLDEAGQAEYAERKADLLETMSCAEYYDASFVPELSYGASDD